MAQTEGEFWDYSLSLYGTPGVSEHCLILQNQYGLDVNLVLFCVWFGHRCGQLPDLLLDEVLAFSSRWRREVVQPLRNVRKTMKGNEELSAGLPGTQVDNLREAIKKIELQAEKLQQAELQRLAAPFLADDSIISNPQAPMENLTSLATRLLSADAESAENHMQMIVALSNKLA